MDIQSSIHNLQRTLIVLNDAFSSVPHFDPKKNFMGIRDQIKQVHLDLRRRVEFSIQENNEVKQRIEKFKESSSRKSNINFLDEDPLPIQKKRRRSYQIDRVYKCAHCEKSYGSEVSLSYHQKNKHGIVYSRRKPTS